MSLTEILNGFRRHLRQPSDSSNETDTVRKIVHQLDQLPPERARYVAAFAYLLSRVARADMNISAEETAETTVVFDPIALS